MADLSGIQAGLAAQASALGNLATQQQQLADQIADLSAGQVNQSELDALAAQAQANADAIQNAADQADALIEPDSGEGEPTPAPGDGETPPGDTT